jgi:hypothetical protein
MANDGLEPIVVFEGSIVETSMIRDMLQEFKIAVVMKDYRMAPYSRSSYTKDSFSAHDAALLVPEKFTEVARELIQQFQDPKNFME